MKNLPIPRLDRNPEVHHHLLKYCQVQEGEIWDDPLQKHRIGCLDAANSSHIKKLLSGARTTLAIHDIWGAFPVALLRVRLL